MSWCCLRPPALLPGNVRKGYNELLSALVLVYDTLPVRSAEALGLRKTKLCNEA